MARPRQVSDQEILATARAIFIERGPSVPTSAIADALGISQPVLFKRFGSKDELMIEALVVKTDWGALLGDGPDKRPLGRQLKELVGRVARHLKVLIPGMAVLRSSRIDPKAILSRFPEGPPPLVGLRAFGEWLERAQELGLVRKDVCTQTTATTLLGALLFRTMLNHTMSIAGHPTGLGAPDDPEELGRIVDQVLGGIQPLP